MALVTKSFSDIITFTRTGTTATYFNSAGVLTSAGADVPRFDYDPATLAARGLLIEEARTNSVRNNTMQGAVAGTPGTLPQVSGSPSWFVFTALTGLTTEIIGTSADSGITYIDIRISGTPSAAGIYSIGFETNTGVAASNGQTWSESVYLKLQAGSFTGVSGIRLQNDERSASAYIRTNASSPFTVSSAALNTQRFSFTSTLSGGATVAFIVPYILLNFTGAAIDITLRIGLPQLELGAFATSVIPTTVASATRNRDEASVNTLSPWFNDKAGTIFCQGLTPPGLANFPSIGPALSDGTLNNRIIQYGFTNGFYGAAVTSGASQGNTFITTTPTIGAQYKFATAYSNNDSQSALNGTASTVDNTYTVPTVNQMQINTGGTVSGNLPNSWVQRITYYPRRLSQAELTAITA